MSVDRRHFWKAISIWTKNSHVVNRRLSGVLQISVWRLRLEGLTTLDVLSRCQKCNFDQFETQFDVAALVRLLPEAYDVRLTCFEALESELAENSVECCYFILQKLVPRSRSCDDAIRIVVLDVGRCDAGFFSVAPNKENKIAISPDVAYRLILSDDDIALRIENVVTSDSKSSDWLLNTVLPKVQKWARSEVTEANSTVKSSSLSLVPLVEYNMLYQILKGKYGQNVVKIWPEATDPSKFVYEDVAIATYLILLWRIERDKLKIENKQSFVDLGCGNGLLVYILSSEGHPGKGVDVRKRGIWDLYPDFVKLEIDNIVPSADYLYNGTDWIIGNHSDELTPWIPVIAARSSYKCNFFLLPCCSYEFDGKKYQRRDSSKSQYNDYMQYVEEICKECKIVTKVDRLKIPSTKRTCFVGTGRQYEKIHYEDNLLSLRNFINSRINCDISKNNLNINEKSSNDLSTENWSSEFKPRDAVEKVRNCTKIEKTITEGIVKLVVKNLLDNGDVKSGIWQTGKCVEISEIVDSVPAEKLKLLKSECGGLQTLLKNHHQIFLVKSGTVQLRVPQPTNDLNCIRKRPCWFYTNHPNSCPLSAEHCKFLHVK